ncbi:MAG: hypothetical protein ABI345_06320 [Jatrophihabitans sp.]
MRRDITRELDMSVRGGWRTVTVGPAEVFRRPDQIAAYVGQLRRSLLRRVPLVEPGRTALSGGLGLEWRPPLRH